MQNLTIEGATWWEREADISFCSVGSRIKQNNSQKLKCPTFLFLATHELDENLFQVYIGSKTCSQKELLTYDTWWMHSRDSAIFRPEVLRNRSSFLVKKSFG